MMTYFISNIFPGIWENNYFQKIIYRTPKSYHDFQHHKICLQFSLSCDNFYVNHPYFYNKGSTVF